MLGRVLLVFVASRAFLCLGEPVHHLQPYDTVSVNAGGKLRQEEPSLMRRVDRHVYRPSLLQERSSAIEDTEDAEASQEYGEDGDADESQQYSEDGNAEESEEYGKDGDSGKSQEYSEDGEDDSESEELQESQEDFEAKGSEQTEESQEPDESTSEEEDSEDDLDARSAPHLPPAKTDGNRAWSMEELREWSESDAQYRAEATRSLALRQKYIERSNLRQSTWNISDFTWCGSRSNAKSCDLSPSNCTFHEEAQDPSCGILGCFSSVCSDIKKHKDETSCTDNGHCFWNAGEDECRFRSCEVLEAKIPCVSNPVCKWDKNINVCKPKPCSHLEGWTSGGEGILCAGSPLCSGQEQAVNGATCLAEHCEGFSSAECSSKGSLGCKFVNGLCKPCSRMTTQEQCTGPDNTNPGNCVWSGSTSSCQVLCNYDSLSTCESKFHAGCKWATAASSGFSFSSGATEASGKCGRVCEDNAAICPGKRSEECLINTTIASSCLALCGKCQVECSILHEQRCKDANDLCNWNTGENPAVCQTLCSSFDVAAQCDGESHCVWDTAVSPNECRIKSNDESSLAVKTTKEKPGTKTTATKSAKFGSASIMSLTKPEKHSEAQGSKNSQKANEITAAKAAKAMKKAAKAMKSQQEKASNGSNASNLDPSRKKAVSSTSKHGVESSRDVKSSSTLKDSSVEPSKDKAGKPK